LAAARERVELAADPGRTPTLGVLRGHGNHERVAFWQGLVALHEGKRSEAERIWRGIVEPIPAMKRLPVKLGEWYTPPKPENEYLRVMAAVALGKTKIARRATKLLARLREEWVQSDLQRHPAPVNLLDGLVAELEGEFGKAERLFAKHLSTAAIRHLAQKHLDAVRAGQRRYENLLAVAPQDTRKSLQKAAAGA